MTKFVHLAQQTGQPSPKKKRKIKLNFSFKTFQIGVIALFFIFGAAYLIQANTISTKGYEISELQERVDELKVRNRFLEDKSLSLQSMQTVSARVEKLQMVKAENTDHLVRPDTAVAVR